MDQPPAVAFTAFADAWPRAIETEIGAGKDFHFFVADRLPKAVFCLLQHRQIHSSAHRSSLKRK